MAINTKNKECLADASAALEAKRDEAKTAWAEMAKYQTAAIEAGAAALDAESEVFKNLDEAGRVYDGLCDEVSAMEATFNRLVERVTEGEPQKAGVTSAPANRQVQSEGEQTPLVNVDAFMEQFLAWREASSPAGPAGRIGTSPSFKLIDKDNIISTLRNATMITTDYPSIPTRRPGIVPLPVQNLSLLDVINTVPVTTDVVEYVYESTFTHAPVETAEESGTAVAGALAYDKASVNCVWIPFTIPATRQMLSDEPRMRNFIGEHLALGIRLRLQHEVINAAGDGDNMKGIVHWTNILTHRSGADSAMPFDVLHKAVTAIRVSTYGMYEPNYVLMNPYDFELAMLAKDGNDTYYYGGPARESMPKIWGLTPIMHSEVTEGAPIVLDSRACELYVREDVSLAVSDSHDTHFTSGIVDFLASGRWGFAVLQPSAVCEVLAFDS